MKPNRRSQIHGNLKKKSQPPHGRHPGNSPITMPQTPAELHKQAASAAQAEYNPTIRQIKGDIRASGQRQQEIGSWYGQLDSTMQRSAAATAAATTAANAAMAAQANGAAASSQADQAAIAGQNADFAKLTGADPAAFAQTTQQAAAAAQQRQLMSAALSAPIAAAGANQAAYLGNQANSARADEIYQHLQERKRTQSMKQDLGAARKERASKVVANLGEQRQQVFDNRLKKQAFGLEGKEAAEQAAHDAASIAATREGHRLTAASSAASTAASERGNNISARNARTAEKKAQWERTHPGKSGGEGRGNAVSTGRNLIRQHGAPRSDKEWAELEEAIAKETEVSPSEARAAVAKLKAKRANYYRKHPGATLGAGQGHSHR